MLASTARRPAPAHLTQSGTGGIIIGLGRGRGGGGGPEPWCLVGVQVWVILAEDWGAARRPYEWWRGERRRLATNWPNRCDRTSPYCPG
jgi:hypothetical protein